MKKLVHFLAALSLVGIAHAGDRLSSDDLKAFLTDKTITGMHFKRGLTKTYYDADGTVHSKSEDGTVRTGKWWIDEDSSKRCIRWSHKAKDFCHYIERNGDGTHTLIHGGNGKHLVEIQSTQAGKHL